jgi:enoyl-CoA hydratase/carnithine racemase
VAEEVGYERIGAAAVLTIERPECRNAVDMPTADALREGFEAFEADDEARVLILTGAGGEAFCAGFDLKSDGLEVDHPAGPLGFTRRTAAKPTIAAIDGPRARPLAASSDAGACR